MQGLLETYGRADGGLSAAAGGRAAWVEGGLGRGLAGAGVMHVCLRQRVKFEKGERGQEGAAPGRGCWEQDETPQAHLCLCGNCMHACNLRLTHADNSGAMPCNAPMHGAVKGLRWCVRCRLLGAGREAAQRACAQCALTVMRTAVARLRSQGTRESQTCMRDDHLHTSSEMPMVHTATR